MLGRHCCFVNDDGQLLLYLVAPGCKQGDAGFWSRKREISLFKPIVQVVEVGIERVADCIDLPRTVLYCRLHRLLALYHRVEWASLTCTG